MRTEVAISLTLVWNPAAPLETRDIPTVRNFLSAVKGMMKLPGRGVSLSGPVSMLEAAFGTVVPEAAPLALEAPVRTMAEVEREALREALLACHGNRTHVAARLGLHLRTVRNRMRAYGLTDEFPLPYPQRGRRKRPALETVLA